jgi:DDE superfamily endonuclease
MDQGIINSFKAYYKKNFLRQCLANDSIIIQYQRSYNLKDAAFMASMAWNEAKITTLISGWKKTIPDLYLSGGASTDLPDISELMVQFQNFQLQKEEFIDWLNIDKDVGISMGYPYEDLIAALNDYKVSVDVPESD